MPVYTTMPIALLHCPDLMVATRSIETGELSEQDAVRAMFNPVSDQEIDHAQQTHFIVATGNLAENAMQSEYEISYSLLTAMRAKLRLDPQQIVIVPGGMDIDRPRCLYYFTDRARKRKNPVPPYWDKWQLFATMIRRFHGTELPKDQPWSLVENADLRVVIAALNSTVAQSHRDEDDHGYLGSEQLAWFADRLARPRYRGWLRIGVLHHRPYQNDAARRDVNGELRDADQFDEILAPLLDLVLHGQPDEGHIRWLANDRVPAIGKPAAGCQRVEVYEDHLLIQPTGGRPVSVTLPHPLPRPASHHMAAEPDNAENHPSSLERLAADVAKICRMRYPHAEVATVPWRPSQNDYSSLVRAPDHLGFGEGSWSGPASTAYLRISPKYGFSGDGTPAEQCPIGVFDATPTREDIQRFLDEVLDRFRTVSANPDAILIHTGASVEQPLSEWARGRGVNLMRFADFQLGRDLDEFVTRQADELRDNRLYPASLYVAQRYMEVGVPWDSDRELADDVLTRLLDWINEPQGRLVLVLGTFGHGKTFLLRQLALRMHDDIDCDTVPVLIDLRGLEKSYSVDELVTVQLTRRNQQQFKLDTLRYLRRAGRIALLFDGFDELVARISYDRATQHLNTILQAVDGEAKIVVACREQYFVSDSQVMRTLGAEPGSRRVAVKLADFDDDQITDFLTNLLGNPAAASARMDLLRDIKDLLGLSRNPRMLSFISDLPEQDLRTATSANGKITAAILYRQILNRWLENEVRRLDRLGPLAPTKADLLAAVTELALRLWDAPDAGLDLDDLDAAGTAMSSLSPTTISDAAGLDPPEAGHLIGSSTLLIRDNHERFTFVHHSVREWLIANHLVTYLTAPVADDSAGPSGNRGGGHLLGRSMSPLVIDFLCGLAEPDTVRAWMKRTLASEAASTAVRRNALEILRHLQVAAPTPMRGGKIDLSGKDFSAQSWVGADLTRANLADTRMVCADLRDANLTEAILVGADLDQATLRGANLSNADLTTASLLGADMTDADLTGAKLYRAALIGATGLSADALAAAADVLGAALPDATAPQPQVWSRTQVRAIATEPHGHLVAGGGADGVIRIWDTHTGAPLRHLTGHSAAVYAVAYASDGRRLASAGHDKTIRIWDTTTGRLIHQLTGHTGRIRAIAWAPDNEQVASAGHDATIRTWNTGTGQVVRVLTGHSGWVRSIAWLPDGRRLISAGDDETIQIWDTTTGQLAHVFTGHRGTVHAVACDGSGRLIASASDDREIYIWDLNSRQFVRKLVGHTGWIRSIAWAADNEHLASAGDDETIRIWNTSTGHTPYILPGHTGWIRSIAYFHNSHRLASAGDDNRIRLWDTATGRQVGIVGSDGGESHVVCFSPDDRWLASGGKDGAVQLWSAAAARPRVLLRHEEAVNALSFSTDSTEVASAGDDATIRIWNPTTGTLRTTLTGHSGAIHCLAYAPHDRRLVSAGQDATIRVWDTDSGQAPQTFVGHTDTVTGVAFSPDGGLLASAGHDTTIRIWDSDTGKPLRTLTGHAEGVRAVVFSPDGQHLASADEDATIRLWDATSGRPLRTLAEHSDAVTAIAFSPDGGQLASAGHDTTIRIWDSDTGRLRSTLAGDTGRIRSIAWAPGGHILASAGGDRAIRLWDVTASRPLAAIVPLLDGGVAVLFDDLRYLLDGVPSGEFWYAVGTCRFEPGDLDAYVPGLTSVTTDARLW